MPNRVSSRSRWRRSNGRGWLVRVPPGAGGSPCAADGEEPQPEARQRRTAAKKGRQSGPSLKESLRNGRSGEIRTHDPQHPMLMRYQAALRSDRGGSADAIDHNDTPRALQLATYHDVSLQLITARGACRAKLGFPEARAAPPPKPLAGLAERGREHPQRWVDRLSVRAETASPGRLSRPAAPEPPCPAAHPRGATSGPRGSCILPDKGTVGSAVVGQRPPADSNGGHPLV